MGFSRQEYWTELPCPPPGDLPDSGIEPVVSWVFCIAGGLPTKPPESPIYTLSKPEEVDVIIIFILQRGNFHRLDSLGSQLKRKFRVQNVPSFISDTVWSQHGLSPVYML